MRADNYSEPTDNLLAKPPDLFECSEWVLSKRLQGYRLQAKVQGLGLGVN